MEKFLLIVIVVLLVALILSWKIYQDTLDDLDQKFRELTKRHNRLCSLAENICITLHRNGISVPLPDFKDEDNHD